MANWRNFYLQKAGTDSDNNAHPTYESVKQWGVWCKDIPFKLFDKVKEPAKRTWYDEHGDDEYIPADGLMLEAYTMDVEFGCKIMKATTDGSDSIPAVEDVRANVAAFLEYLRTNGMLMIYSAHTRIGRTDVRLDSVGSDAKWKREKALKVVSGTSTMTYDEYLVFKVTFKVNDPKTDVTLDNNGKLVIVVPQANED